MLTPIISWDAPATPRQFWIIRLAPVTVVNGKTRVHPGQGTSMRVAGDATSALVPPGYLQPASHYIISVEGFSHTNIDQQKTPSANAVPACFATAVSDLVNTP